jgi:hypothetical protein
MASYKSHICTGSVSSAEDARCALEELGSECREIVDNAPEGLQQSERISTFEESASALENISEFDIPECVADLPIEYSEQRVTRKGRSESRAVRCSNAVAVLEAARDALDTWLEDEENEGHDDRDEVESLHAEIDQAIADAEPCEFPGMFG